MLVNRNKAFPLLGCDRQPVYQFYYDPVNLFEALKYMKTVYYVTTETQQTENVCQYKKYNGK